MAYRTNTVWILGVAIVLCMVGCSKGRDATVIDHLRNPLQTSGTIRVGAITDNLPPDVDEGDKPSVEDIQKFKNCLLAEMEKLGYQRAASTDGQTAYTIVGRLMEYKGGSWAARAFLGFGVGNAKLVSELQLLDGASGEVLFGGLFEGKVENLRSSDDMFVLMAKSFTEALQKQHEFRGGAPLREKRASGDESETHEPGW